MKRLSKKYEDVLENLGWNISSYTDDERVEIGQSSPAVEDFYICVEICDFPQAVADYASQFDVDEHIAMWIEAKHNGVQGVPDVRTLVYDAEAIQNMLEELAIELAKVKNPNNETTMNTEMETMIKNNKTCAHVFVSAIKEISKKPENLDNLEGYLSQHFQEWLKKYASDPVSISEELKSFAEMEI